MVAEEWKMGRSRLLRGIILRILLTQPPCWFWSQHSASDLCRNFYFNILSTREFVVLVQLTTVFNRLNLFVLIWKIKSLTYFFLFFYCVFFLRKMFFDNERSIFFFLQKVYWCSKFVLHWCPSSGGSELWTF